MTIGSHVTIGAGVGIASEERIEIGDRVTIGDGVLIMDTDFHDSRDLSHRGATAAVIIGEGVRIESNAIILKGTHLGSGARVARRSVVSGRIPEGGQVCGVPARMIPDASCRKHHGLVGDRGSISDRLTAIVTEACGVEGALRPEEGPSQIIGWDSLGALRVLIAMEEEFRISLPEHALCAISTLRDLEEIVAEALGQASCPDHGGSDVG
jgi:acyl carrier protein